jgi:hypothetical protein
MALEQRPDIETLAFAIAHSPIIVARAWLRKRAQKCAQKCIQECAEQPSRAWFFDDFPAGFEDADLAILRWIAEEGRHVGRRLMRL